MKHHLATPMEFCSRVMDRMVARMKRAWLPCVVASAVLGHSGARAASETQAGGLRMEVITAYNLVVDSNVETPASYTPRSAYMGVKISNTGASALTDVYVRMGDLTNTSTGAGTPGTYPVTSVAAGAGWGYYGDFSLTHEGGAGDATRHIQSLAAGASTVVYWLVSYPVKDARGKTVTGATNSVADDLRLNYDVWAQVTEGVTPRLVYDERHVTCRNEISAMANKIWPNTASKVPDQYLNAIQATLGWRPSVSPRVAGAIKTEGIWYDLGNVGAGFDNNNDLIPDRNAWMQPVGDPALFDASALRLVKAYGIVIVKLNDGTEELIPFEDRLYFEHILANNTGAVGLVYYEFMPLRSGGSATLSPYQEVASGYNNEKFNGDYGATISTGTVPPSSVSIDKTGPATIAPGGVITYNMLVTNTSATTAFGNPEFGLPAAVSDAIPANCTYVPNSASASGLLNDNTVEIRYSIDSGATWTTTDPGSAVTNLQWWFAKAMLPGTPGESATVTFKVMAPSSATATPIVNTAGFGLDGLTPLVTDSVTTAITGAYSISGLVYKDDGTGGGISGDGVKNGTEGTSSAICGSIDVTLYRDINANGVVDSGDIVRTSTTSSGADGTWSFTNLPNGSYVVQVSRNDTDRPTGYALSTVDSFAVTINNASQSGYEFGFAPTLSMTKTLAGTSPVLEGSYVSYNIAISDLLKSAAWSASQKQTQDLWLTNASGTGGFSGSAANAAGAGTGTPYATATTTGTLTGTDPIDPAAANQTTPITHVEALIDLKANPLFGSDTLKVQVVKQGVTLPTSYTLSANAINAYQNSTGLVSINVTDLTTWTWADLKASNTGLTLTFTRNAGTLNIDRFGFRVTTVAADNNGSNLFWSDATTTLKVGHANGDNIEVLMPSLTASPIEIAFDNVNNLVYIGYANGVIERRNPDGTAVTTLLTDTGNAITGLEVDPIGGYFYWTTASAVNRSLISSPAKIALATGSQIGGLAKSADDYRLYWISSASNTVNIESSYFDGTNKVTLVSSTLGLNGNTTPLDIEVDATNRKMYFTARSNSAGNNFIGVANLDGSNAHILLTTGVAGLDGLALDVANNLLYWADQGGIKRATLVGTGSTTIFPNLATVSALEKPKFTNSSVGIYDSHKTLAVVPLVDTYAADKLTYVSASIPPDLTSVVGNNGTLTWNNVGPINPDITKTITVTFRATPISGNATATNVPNTATITNPLMSDGVAANNATSTANIDITATARIGDFVWQEKNGNTSYQSGTDLPLPGVVVRLYASDGTTLLESTTTNAAGAYEFSSVSNATYVVKIDTTTLPNGLVDIYDADGTGTANQSTLTIAGAADNLLQDFGYTFTAAMIYGTVWGDDSGEGTRGTLEAGIPGVTVWLKNGAGTVIATSVTDANGNYRFVNVNPALGPYYVEVSTGTLPTLSGATWSQTADPDATLDSRTPSGANLTVVGGVMYGSYDFGYTQTGTGSIGDAVFYDWDHDNIQDSGDEGIPGVAVNLYQDGNLNGLYDPGVDHLIRTTETSGSGYYIFSNLQPGRYLVVVDEGDAQFPDSVSASASNPRPATLYTGTVLTNVDFGYFPVGSGSITGTVWHDVNGNQLQSGSSETGIANITVTLQVDLNGDGTWVDLQTTSTDSSGNYSFSSLGYLAYRVVVNATDTDMPKDGTGSFYDPTTAIQFSRTLTIGSPTATANFGFTALPSIGDFVFWDANANGTQDAGESGIANVPLKLYTHQLDGNGNVINLTNTGLTATTVDGTGANPQGFYQFTSLPILASGYYYLVAVDRANWPGGNAPVQTADPDRDGVPAAAGGSPSADDRDQSIVLGAAPYTGADFGYLPSGVIGDFVWLDQDGDGVQDAGEAGIAGVSVFIDADNNGTLNWTDAGSHNGVWDAGEGEQWTTTDNDGYYSFANLANGTYAVTLVTLAGTPLYGKVATYDADGTGTPNKTTVILSNGTITSPSGKGSLDIDFGLKLNGTYSISGGVCIHDTGGGTTGRILGLCDDIDNFADDGTDLDVGPLDETELSGLTVYLYTEGGTYLGMTTTDADGKYSFAGLPNGNYKVVLDSTPSPLNHATLNIPSPRPAGVTAITPNPSATNPTSVVSAVTITDANVTHVDYAFTSTVNYDFGDLPSSYEATTWANDGARHIIPTGGTTVYLGSVKPDADVNGQAGATADGDDQVVGSIIVDDEDGVVPLNIGSWHDGSGGGSVQVTIPNGVTGYLVGWIDFNHNNSLIDLTNGTSENIISRWITGTGSAQTLTFDIPSGTIGATDESWLARFRIFAEQPAYPIFAYKGEATNGETEDYLFQRPVNAAIGDRVWVDTNHNGIQDAGESGLEGVLVTLSGTANRTQTTSNGSQDVDGDGVVDPPGYYRFANLAEGSYTVSIPSPVPTGYTYSYDEDTGTSNPNGSTVVSLAANAQHLTADFGLRPLLANISGSVFHDTNHNNAFGGDTPLSSVVVQLWSDPNRDGDPGDGVQVAETFTNGSGAYAFTSVPSGSYVVVEVDPNGAVSDADTYGANDNRILVNLTGMDSTGNNFLDDGTPAYAVSGTVYDDVNHDFVLNGSDTTPLAGVTVTLYADLNNSGTVDAGDVLIGTQVTNGSGQYAFTGVPNGNYLVVETDLTAPLSYASVTDSDGNTNGSNTLDVTVSGANSTGNNFLDFRQACPDTWTAWGTKWTGQPGISGQTGYHQNPDNDRYDNLIEYAFCLPPNSGALKPFCLTLSGTGKIDGVFRRTAGGTTDVAYTLEYSASLTPTSWLPYPIIFPPNAGSNVTITNKGDGTETVTIADLEAKTGLNGLNDIPAGPGEGFVRMRVDLADGVTAVDGDHTAYAEVLGWTETVLGTTNSNTVRCRTYNNPYQHCAPFGGKVDVSDGVDGQTLFFTNSAAGTADLATVLPSVDPETLLDAFYYLEVTTPNGANEGQRFDVVSVTGKTVTLANDASLRLGTPPFNTLTGALSAMPASLAGDSVIIRRHRTLGEMFPVSGFRASGTQTDADQVQTYAPGDVTPWTTYYLYTDGATPTPIVQWVKVGSTDPDPLGDQGNTVIPPGQGMFVNRAGVETTLLAYGEVRENDFKRPLCAGYNLVGGGYPIDQSATDTQSLPVSRRMNLAAGFFGSRDFKTADSFYVWQGDSTLANGYDTYYLLNNAPTLPSVVKWVKVGDAGLTSKDTSPLMLSDRSVFIRVKNALPTLTPPALPTYTMPCPWTP